ncbi:hypothetical protein F5B21DRAFT_103955 [Xylaria acuta]|nr:hypothetical protein F5B21DRAFT_103955 [Xylaria acuta]
MAGDLAQSRQPYSVDSDSDERDAAPQAADTDAQAQRKRVNRVLRLTHRQASLYELLDVNANADHRDILAGWKRAIVGIHPDKNHDPESLQCAKAINDAKDVLSDPKKREIYDRFIEQNPPPPKASVLTFGEDFAPNAFEGDGSDDGMDEDEDDGENEEQNYPPPKGRVKRLHQNMTPYIEAFFDALEEPINFILLHNVEKINKQIEGENAHHDMPLSLYTVPQKKLLFYQYGQRRIYMSCRTGQFGIADVQRETSWLQAHFEKTRQKGLYRWPAAWVQLLTGPLHRALGMLGVSVVQQMPGDGAPPPPDADDNGDVEMEDVDEEAERSRHQDTGSPIQPVRRGRTMSGETILGYVPTQRWSHGESVVTSIRLFVKVKGRNPMKVVSGVDDAALAYHQLPKHKKNNIKENAVQYARMTRTDFVRIVGIAWVTGTSPGRLPDTYVWVETRAASDKPHIVTRSTLRDWLGKGLADRRIESWLEEKKINPGWAQADNSRRLLTYPPQPGDSRSRVQRGGTQPPPSGDYGHVDALTKLTDVVLQMQVEAREDRRQQRELLRAILPAPGSGA